MKAKEAIEYFYRQMERGLIENDTQQEVYELAISALEKQIPKKPLEQRYEIENELIGHCPACKLRWGVAYWQRYCSNCGQKLDWSWRVEE